jgi:ATP-dependent Clp protease ATP-binding subunit ClpB
VLLQILDDGRLTDSQGRTVDFRNTVIIMTSNLGGQMILDGVESDDWDATEAAVMDTLRGHFRPEFLNRVDDTIVYKPLTRVDLRSIVDIQLHRVEDLARELGVLLTVTEEAKDFLAAEGFDPAFGARPLKRAIQREVQDPLALYLLDEEVPEGSTITVSVAHDGRRLAFERAPEAAPEGSLQPA